MPIHDHAILEQRARLISLTIMSFGAGAEVGPIATEEPVLDRAVAILLLVSRLSPSRLYLLHRHANEYGVGPDGLGCIRRKVRVCNEIGLSAFLGDIEICLQPCTATDQPKDREEA